MTVVDFTTGEVVETVTRERAEQITQRIRLLAESVADGIDRLVERIQDAQRLGVHEALGYRSWTEYVSTEFQGVLPRLDREPRRELVATLAESGMSTRAIAPIVGVSKDTVHRDLAPVSNETPQTTEGASTNASVEPSEADSEDEVACTPGATTGSGPDATPPRPPIIGIDGKKYTRPEAVKRDEDEAFWDDAAAKAEESGFVARREAERPYSVAVIALCHAAEDVSKLALEPEDLAAHVPAHVTYRLPEIEQMAEWLSRFVSAVKESA